MLDLRSLCIMGVFSVTGCWKDNPAFGQDDTGAASSSSGQTTMTSADTMAATETSGTDGGSGGGTTTSPTTGGVDTTGSGVDTGTSSTTEDASTTGAASDSESGSTGGSTTGGQGCEVPAPMDPPRLQVKKDGQVLMACSGAKTITNAFATFSGSTLQIYDSGACAEEGTLYEVSGVNFTITPLAIEENCSEVTIEWASEGPCEVTGFALRSGEVPYYVGGFGRLTGPSGYEAFEAQPQFVCGCAVDDIMCCEHSYEIDQSTYQPGAYLLGFGGAEDEIGPEESILGSVDGNGYTFRNLRSDVDRSCSAAPSHVWLDVRWWAQLSE